MKHETIEILNIPFANITQEQALDILEGFLNEQKNHIIVTPNPEGVMQSSRNLAFAEALINADLSLADGIGILLASILLGKRLPERVRGVDTAFALFKRLAEKNRPTTVYFLGGKDGIAQQAAQNMQAKYPNLKIIGYHHGFAPPEDEPRIVAEINELAPEILFVCTGMPRAELWATRNKNINTRLTLCLGGTIDIMAGNVKLAPAPLRRIGMEWLYRLITQPSRALRMLDIPRFMLTVLFKG